MVSDKWLLKPIDSQVEIVTLVLSEALSHELLTVPCSVKLCTMKAEMDALSKVRLEARI